MLIADLSGQGFLGLCGSDHTLRILSCHLLSKLWPSSRAQTLTAYFILFLCAIVGTGKETQLAMWKSGLCFLLKYIIHSTFCRLDYSCAPSTQYIASSPGWVLLSRLGQNYETVIVGHELTPGWAQDRGWIQNTVSSMGQYSASKSANIFRSDSISSLTFLAHFNSINSFTFPKKSKKNILISPPSPLINEEEYCPLVTGVSAHISWTLSRSPGRQLQRNAYKV